MVVGAVLARIDLLTALSQHEHMGMFGPIARTATPMPAWTVELQRGFKRWAAPIRS